jgi:hypothetical protein
VLLWAVVLAVTMLSFYVHLLHGQVERAQVMRAAPQPVVQQAKAAVRGQAGKQRRAPQAERVAAGL